MNDERITVTREIHEGKPVVYIMQSETGGRDQIVVAVGIDDIAELVNSLVGLKCSIDDELSVV